VEFRARAEAEPHLSGTEPGVTSFDQQFYFDN
jgi:hypothetical protein